MIPKIIHHIWVGDNEFPKEFEEFIEKWKLLYPDYNYIFWNDVLVESTKIIDESISKYYYSKCKMAFKADLLRFKILEKYGGIYVDTDVEPLRRMPDEFLNYKLFAGRQKPDPEVAIGLIGAEPNNDLIKYYIKKMIENIKLNIDSEGNVSQELWRITGPQYFNKICNEYLDRDGYKFFDSEYFHPYGWNELERRYENFKETSPNSYSVHHWTLSWW